MKHRIIIVLVLLAAVNCLKLRAQDVSFSQVYSSPLYLSPSFAGFTDGGRFILNYRDQWPAIPNTFRTYAFSYDQYVSHLNSGIGLLALHDDQGGGQLVTQNVGLVYAYELAITSDVFVRPGLQFKYFGMRIDPGKMATVGSNGIRNPWSTIYPDFPVDQFHKFDASASLMVYSNYFWLGSTVDHLVKSNVGFTDIETRIPIKTTIFGGGKWRYIEASRGRSQQSISMAFMFRRQESFQQLDLGVYWNVEPLEVGLWYRGIPGISSANGLSNNDALIFSLGVNLGDFHIAYSYDLTLSNLAAYSGGSNEFSLIYRFSTGTYTPNRGAVPCGGASAGLGEAQKYSRSARRSIF